MTSELIPVEGLYESRADGERAANAAIERGFSQTTVLPLTEVNLSALPMADVETNRRMVRSMLAIPVGFIVLAPPGLALSLIAGPLIGIFCGLLLGSFGAVVAFMAMDRPPERYRQLAKNDGVLVTVACPRESCSQVLQILDGTHPAELFAPRSRA